MPSSIENAIVARSVIENVVENIEYNKNIIRYYTNYRNEVINKDTISNKIYNLENCNKFWSIDKYEKQKLKDIIKQNLCHDKFCSNCKKVRQAARMAKYIPELEQYKGNMYHLTLTVQNVNGEYLADTIKNMGSNFKYLTRILDGRTKIKGMKIDKWKYKGAIRSLEITYKKQEYHPHFHVCLIMDPKVLSEKNIINVFSYDYSSGYPILKRKFSKEEILIQKIWFLIINNEKITIDTIDKLDVGYSCTIEKFPDDDYAELFKYLTKDKDEDGNIITYNQFKTLYESTYRTKQIQGYGCLYRINDDIDMEVYENKWNEFIESVREKENPERVSETPQDLLCDTDYKLISRKSYFSYLRQL